MKLFVKVDFWVQVILYTLLFLSMIIYSFYSILPFLMLIGGWQLMTAIVLTIFFSDQQRAQYLRFAPAYLLISPLIYISPSLFIAIYLMGAFGIAIWYSKITYHHNRRLQTTFRSFWDLEI